MPTTCSVFNGGPPSGCIHNRSLEPKNVNPFGKRVFANVIKDLEMRSPLIIQAGSVNTMLNVLRRDIQETQT